MMYSQSYDLNFNSVNNARVVVSWQWQYEAVKKGVWVFLGLFFLVPGSYFFGLWLFFKRKRFEKYMQRKLPVFKTNKDYYSYKQHLTQLDELVPTLRKLTKYNKSSVPLLLRFCFVQMQAMSNVVVVYYDWLNSNLDVFNTEYFKSKSKVFKFTSEKELWGNRNQAYNYWM